MSPQTERHEIPEALFEPLQVRSMTIPNRVVMPPMGSNMASASGQLTNEHFDYYRQRARGGTGLIIVENATIAYPVASNGNTQLRLDHDRFIPRMYELTDMMHSFGSAVAIQLNHAGASANPERTGMAALSSSNIPSKTGGAIPVPMTLEEIRQTVTQYGKAARRAMAAGFDCVEVHAGHAYLLCQFLSPRFNKRTDEYGGSPENRARIVTEVLAEVRKQVGATFPISLRLSADELLDGGNTLEDTLAMSEFFAKEVDIFNVSAALNDNLQYQIDKMSLPDGWRAYMARAYKEKFGRPVIATGNIRDPQVAEKLLVDGDADLIGIGRGLIADPFWVRKVRRGETDRILHCISCNIGCADNRIRLGRPLRCTINPDIIDNESYRRRRVGRPVKVVVVGGGVAGLEAACTAAEVGCEVVLMERSDSLGGIIATASDAIPAKARIGTFLDYQRRRVERSGVDVRFGATASLADVEAEDPDIVVNATGSAPIAPPITGLRERMDKPGTTVMSINGAMRRLHELFDLDGKRVVVVGAGAVGLDLVEQVAPQGAKVTLVERLPKIAQDLDLITRLQMLEVVHSHDVDVRRSTSLLEVHDDAVTLEGPDGTVEDVPADYIFICLGMRAVPGPVAALTDHYRLTGVPVLNIGDSVRARKIIDGVREGRAILRTLEDIDAL